LYEFGAFRLDPGERLLLHDGKSVQLPPKAFLTLVLLVEHSGRVRGKEELMRAVWPETFVEENNLTQCISVLRKALGENGRDQSYIETVPKLGYRFVEPVRRSLAGVETNGFASVRHSHSRIVIRQEEEIEEDEAMDAAPVPVPAVAATGVHPVVVRAPAEAQRSFVARHRLLLATSVLFVGIAIAAYSWLRGAEPPKVLGYAPLSRNVAPGTPLLTDGRSLYFTVSPTRVAQMSVMGGEPALLPGSWPELGLGILDFSPTRPEMLATGGTWKTGERALWIVPVPAGSPRRIGELYVQDGSWSSNGESILYAHENGLYIAQRDGTLPHRVVQLPGLPWASSWSPDGKWIRFGMRQGDSNGLWEVAADGSNLRLLLTGGVEIGYRGQWTADGRYFILPLNHDGRLDLWAVPRTRDFPGYTPPEPIRLTSGPINLISPVLSRDGRRIFAVGFMSRVEILRRDVATNSFVPFLSGVSADGLAFSSDGKWVTYSTYPDRALWRSRIDGNERLQLTFTPMESLQPRWSPDGKTIAFMGRSPGKPWQIYRISAQGGLPGPLAAGPDDQASPAWSPDGNVLVYAGAPWQNNFVASSTAIYSLDLRTHQVAMLPDSQGLWSPRWSPDGRYLVAETIDSQGLKLFDFRLRKWVPLVEISQELLDYTAWSHDSKYVYFNAHGQNSAAVYRVAIEGSHRIETAADLKSLPPAYTLGEWFTLDPDDSILVLRDTSIQEIYALDVRFP